MDKKKELLGGLLFAIQIALAIWFCERQFAHMWVTGVQPGVSVAMFVFMELYALINVDLQFRKWRSSPSWNTLQPLGIYFLWAVLWGANVCLVITQLLRNPRSVWGISDAIATAAVLIGLAATKLVAKRKSLSSGDPLVKGGNALVFKAVPQLFQAWKFFAFGGASWDGWAVFLGHVTILLRSGHLILTLREGRSRETLGSLISELGNELSWLIATAAWLWWKFS